MSDPTPTDSAAGISAQFSNNKFFNAAPRNLTVAVLQSSQQSVTKLVPKGDGLIDIVNNLQWKNSGSSDEVPSIIATEYELDYGQWTQNLANLISGIKNVATGEGLDIYQQIYHGTPTGFKYHFPWLITNGDNIRNVQSSWGKVDGLSDIISGAGSNATSQSNKGNLGNILGGLAGAAVGAFTPGVGFEQINEYKETTAQDLTISFPLYNTVSIEKAYDHHAFISLLTFQNLKTRTSIMTFVPPKLYNVQTLGLGGVYMPVAYIANLKIDSIGTTRILNEFSSYGTAPILIPEAYKVTITFKELLPQSSNIFAGTMGGVKVQVIGNKWPISGSSGSNNTSNIVIKSPINMLNNIGIGNPQGAAFTSESSQPTINTGLQGSTATSIGYTAQ